MKIIFISIALPIILAVLLAVVVYLVWLPFLLLAGVVQAWLGRHRRS